MVFRPPPDPGRERDRFSIYVYYHGDIHIWETDHAPARDLEGVGAPTSVVLEQIKGVAIRCTIMVFRRLRVLEVTCF